MLLKAGTQYAIRNTQYANPVKLYCVIRKRLPQDAIAQNAAYGVPYISRRAPPFQKNKKINYADSDRSESLQERRRVRFGNRTLPLNQFG